MKSRTRIASLASILLLPGGAAAQVGTSTFSIGLEPVTNVGGPPLDLTHAGDGTNRLFLAGQNTGDVRLFKDNTLLATPFLDINGTTGATAANIPLATGGERGLLGMAFHPNFAAPSTTPGSGKFYTYTSEPKAANFANVDFIHDELDGTDTLPGNLGDHDSVIREWTVNSDNPDQINVGIAPRVIMRIRQPQSNHNGGAMKFGPDGYMYIAMGDGGGGNDNSGGFTSPTDGHTNNTGNAQDINNYAQPRHLNVLGKILRIDPRAPGTTGGSPDPQSLNGLYRIPADNPFVGPTAGADEIFAYGVRNPFRISFDRLGGALYAGDVGQGQREEVDIITSGGNFGWVYWEGNRVNVAEPAGMPDIKPIGEYTHADGQAVIGGFVYRGSNIPELYGQYIFGELGWNDPATPETTVVGRIFHMAAAGGTINQLQYLLNAPVAQLYAFGEDRDGELYAMFANGDVQRILGRQWYATTGGSWGTASNWLGATPNAAGAAANFLGRVTAPASVPAVINLDGNRTVGTILFNNNVTNAQGISYRIAQGSGGGTLTLNGTAGATSIKVIKGNHEITAPLSIQQTADLDVAAAGSINITGPLTLAGSRTLSKKGVGSATLSGGANLQASSTIHVVAGTLAARNVIGGSIIVNDGARMNLQPNGGPVGTSKIAALTVDGKLDLADNKLIVTSGGPGVWNGTAYTGATGAIVSAFNFGAWDGDGITTSMPAALTGVTGIGIATGEQMRGLGPTDTDTFSGQVITGASTVLMYTYIGDANLDGQIDAGDYGTLDAYVQIAGASGYANGDFNFDGFIDPADYGTIDNNIQYQGPPFSTAATGVTSSAVAPVPEPAGALAVVAALTSMSMIRRRRRAAK